MDGTKAILNGSMAKNNKLISWNLYGITNEINGRWAKFYIAAEHRSIWEGLVFGSCLLSTMKASSECDINSNGRTFMSYVVLYNIISNLWKWQIIIYVRNINWYRDDTGCQKVGNLCFYTKYPKLGNACLSTHNISGKTRKPKYGTKATGD